MQPVFEFAQRQTAKKRASIDYEMVCDNFAGAGGASMGIEAALGRAVDVAINHNPLAVQIHAANHPNTKHECENIWKVDPASICAGRQVGLAWFSPDCKHFSRAKGGKPVSKKIRGLAWVVTKWANLVRPRVIILENVCEFQTWGPIARDGKPIASRKGETFQRWVKQLENYGYQVQWRELVAADFGVPTIRRRLFLIARRDGEAIVWPKKTHANRKVAQASGLKAWRPAADCILWELPCRSIFDRKKPLAKNTLRRVAIGLKKYVLENQEPFIVTANHSGSGFRGQGLTDPLLTVTGSRDAHGLVLPYISPYHHQKHKNEVRAQDPADPLATLDTQNRHALVMAFLNKHYTGVVGQGLNKPLGTVTAIDHHSLTSVFVVKNKKRSTAQDINEPTGTGTTRSHQSLAAAFLTKFRGTATAQSLNAPMPTVTGQGKHVAEVRAFLIKYFGTAIGQDVKAPAATLTGRHRLGLVLVKSVWYQIVDIGLRMLVPLELLRAQFGKYAKDYILLGTKEQQVAGIGNSVCPEVAEALVKANVEIRRVPVNTSKDLNSLSKAA